MYMSISKQRQTQAVRLRSKSAAIATRDQIAIKLREAGVLGVTPQTDRFYSRFADFVAGMEKGAIDLGLAWELAVRDTLNGCPPAMAALLSLDFDLVIDAVAPEPETAERAKSLRRGDPESRVNES